ncbi:MAG: hypothetical protein JXA42_21720 [Anaerolineales bacterium]|nr:hypothetical protein [Anaerolineales bacterium]
MDKEQVRLFKDRWKAVEEIEAQERMAETIESKWRKLNALYLMGKQLGLLQTEIDEQEMAVYLRWSELKKAYRD